MTLHYKNPDHFRLLNTAPPNLQITPWRSETPSLNSSKVISAFRRNPNLQNSRRGTIRRSPFPGGIGFGIRTPSKATNSRTQFRNPPRTVFMFWVAESAISSMLERLANLWELGCPPTAIQLMLNSGVRFWPATSVNTAPTTCGLKFWHTTVPGPGNLDNEKKEHGSDGWIPCIRGDLMNATPLDYLPDPAPNRRLTLTLSHPTSPPAL